MTDISKARVSAEFIREKIGTSPCLGIILGTGLGGFAKNIEDGNSIPYGKIPHFPETGVKGHSGRLAIGTIKGLSVAAMQGRFHYYEGYSMKDVTFPVTVLHQLGIQLIIVTNAAGGINPDFNPGDIMLIKDHINLMGTNPIINYFENGIAESEFEPFINMTDTYDKRYMALTEGFAQSAGINLKKGILAAVPGPIYETPAEIEMLKRLGADAVCMSTVPEVIMARALNMKVIGISLITNKSGEITRHVDVIKESEKNIDKFSIILKGIIDNFKEDPKTQVKTGEI
ncbi:MAG: purine-nucleoside phosphorylase [Nitrospinae bacterium]|nr:purine-nucleoside phosphorylase [Nitrospinota bacterium]